MLLQHKSLLIVLGMIILYIVILLSIFTFVPTHRQASSVSASNPGTSSSLHITWVHQWVVDTHPNMSHTDTLSAVSKRQVSKPQYCNTPALSCQQHCLACDTCRVWKLLVFVVYNAIICNLVGRLSFSCSHKHACKASGSLA